jgi:hypothetical protein
MIISFVALILALLVPFQESSLFKSLSALPLSPAQLPTAKVHTEAGGEVERYRFDENKDELTNETTVSIRITLKAEPDDVISGKAGHDDMIFFQYRTPKNAKGFCFLIIARATDDLLGKMLLTSHYSIAFSPLGMDPVRIGARGRIESVQSGYYREVATIELKDPTQMVETLTSPRIRLERTDGSSKDYRLTETDKMAVLWVIENKVQGGEEAIDRVRKRLDAVLARP